jgi:hypothetical protein
VELGTKILGSILGWHKKFGAKRSELTILEIEGAQINTSGPLR